MTDLFTIERVEQPDRIGRIAAELREVLEQQTFPAAALVALCDRWAGEIVKTPAGNVPGAVFLGMWLRAGTLEALLSREFGLTGADAWEAKGRSRFRTFPVGVVGHWPAANVQILPILSGLCALLGGNTSLVRVPPAFCGPVQLLLDSLRQVDEGGDIIRRMRFVTFASDCQELQEAMARSVDGAMIWGGKEAVSAIRALPFPYWARFMVFGPRVSVAALDKGAWSDATARPKWCLRLARDVWQFDQMACSSPQVLFVERAPGDNLAPLVDDLVQAFKNENAAHPRHDIEASLAAAIVKARATALLDNVGTRAVFPAGPDWTIVLHDTLSFPEPVQGKTLNVVPVDDLSAAIGLMDGNVQTLGLGMTEGGRERAIAEQAGRRGIDRIVRLGGMHVFDSPWDGTPLVTPMVRLVRHTPSSDL